MRRWPDKINRFPQISPLPLQRDARPIRHPCRSVPGVEPTWTGPPYGRCPQPVAWPSGSSVSQSPAQVDGRQSSFLSKSSDLGLHHQKRPFFRQHFLKRLPLPQGQRSLRPSFSSRILSPCTMRTPRPTCVSDGNPFRRLLIVSKKTAVRRICLWTWDTSIRDSVQKKRQKCPRQESNRAPIGMDAGLVPRPSQGRVRIHHTPRTDIVSALPRSRTSSDSFEDCHALHHTRRACELRDDRSRH